MRVLFLYFRFPSFSVLETLVYSYTPKGHYQFNPTRNLFSKRKRVGLPQLRIVPSVWNGLALIKQFDPLILHTRIHAHQPNGICIQYRPNLLVQQSLGCRASSVYQWTWNNGIWQAQTLFYQFYLFWHLCHEVRRVQGLFSCLVSEVMYQFHMYTLLNF